MNMAAGLRTVLRPGVMLPLLLSAALLAVALSLGQLGEVLARVQAIGLWVMAFALAMAVVYLVIKYWQLHILLQQVSLHPGRRRLLLAFAVGELSLTLPLGIFAQNWMLSVTARDQSRFGRSSSATVMMLIAETLVVLLVLAAVSVPRWPQLQPIAALFAAGLLGVFYLALHFGHLAERLPRRARHPLVSRILVQLNELVRGLQRIYRPRLLVIMLISTTAYLAALALAFLVVGRNMGMPNLGFPAAATIYAFSLAVVLMFGGLFSQIGLIEVLGIGAAQAWGLSLTDGLALMLGFRLVWTGSLWLINLPVVLVLWHRI